MERNLLMSRNITVTESQVLDKDHGTSAKTVANDLDSQAVHFHSENNSISAQPAPRRRATRMLQGYIVTDSLAVMVGFLLAWNLTLIINNPYFSHMGLGAFHHQDNFRVGSYLAIAAGCLLWFQYKGHYRVRMNFWMELQNVMKTFGIGLMVNGFLQVATKTDLSRLWLMSAWVFAAFSIVLFRGLYRIYLRSKGIWNISTLLVGSGNTADDTRAALAAESGMGYAITAQIKNLPSAFMQAGRSWERLCAQYDAEYVMIALDGREMEEAEKPIAQLMRESVPFSISPPRRNLPVLDMVPQYFFNSDVKLLTHNSGLEQPLPRFVKRVFDIVVSGVALLCVSPVFLMLAVMIKRDGGPVFFGHKRIGKNGKTFSCLKFRSMSANSEEMLKKYLAEDPDAWAEWEATQKLKNDPRITKFGQFLRATSLDELPQVINVLRGEMSLVGPRPIVQDEVSKYDYDIAHYYRVSPGITGLWQVSGRNDVSYAQRVKMDSWYVRNWSLWHDIAILCKTLPALLKRRGAY